MQFLRILAVVSFFAGAALLVYGLFFAHEEHVPRYADSIPLNIEATPTLTPAITKVPQAGTPTPVPYDGPAARMRLEAFGVDAPIEYIGLLSTNELDVPHNPLNVGLYDIEGYGKPGYGSNSVFSAHVDYYPNIVGPFNKLARSKIDDVIAVVMDDGTEYRYRVIRVVQYDVETIPMGDLIWPRNKPDGAEWVTLITCGGEFLGTRGQPGEYKDRIVVVAERVS